MRIGIVTWFESLNFGTNLQAYALFHYLEQQGHKVKFIRFFNTKRLGFLISLLKNIKNYKSKIKRFFQESTSLRKRRYIVKQFVNEILPVYPLIKTKKQYKKMLEYFDCFITGSDQIWNPYHHLNSFFLLDFNLSKPSYAYASSIGVNMIPEEKKDVYRKHLAKFKAIGVREQTGVNVLSEITSRNDIVNVLDPTFLLKREDWKEFAGKDKNIHLPYSDYLFVYTIGSRPFYPEYVKKIQSHYGIQHLVVVQAIESSIIYDADDIFDVISVMGFVKLLINATMVITDSFHATAICINMNIDFIELLRFDDEDRMSQNSRIRDVLSHYKLDKRLYEGNEFPPRNIDYEMTNQILFSDRQSSYRFLYDIGNPATFPLCDYTSS